MTADNWAILALIAVCFGWMWLYRREARRADRYHRMLHNVLDMLERHGQVHVHRRCACQAHWLMDGETVTADGLRHGQHSCQPEAEVIPRRPVELLSPQVAALPRLRVRVLPSRMAAPLPHEGGGLMGPKIIEPAEAMRWLPDRMLPPATPAQVRAASLVLAGRADTADQLRDWLTMLGIHRRPDPGGDPAPAAPPRPKVRAKTVDSPDRPTGPRLDAYGLVDRCRRGHEMNADNTRWTGNGSGRWCGRCRACDRAAWTAAQARRGGA